MMPRGRGRVTGLIVDRWELVHFGVQVWTFHKSDLFLLLRVALNGQRSKTGQGDGNLSRGNREKRLAGYVGSQHPKIKLK